MNDPTNVPAPKTPHTAEAKPAGLGPIPLAEDSAQAGGDAVNATTESSFWKATYMTKPYVHTGFGFEEYEPAYKYGWESAGRNGAKGQTFESVESELSLGWNHARSGSRLAWDQARQATRDAWNRVQESARAFTKILKD